MIKQKLSLFTNFILLSIVYFIGIGITSIFAKIFGKSFLSVDRDKKQKTSFVNFKESNSLERMF